MAQFDSSFCPSCSLTSNLSPPSTSSWTKRNKLWIIGLVISGFYPQWSKYAEGAGRADETPSTAIGWIAAFVVWNHWNQNVFFQNAYWGGERRASGSS